MKEARYFYVPGAATRSDLPEEEARHATRVLRLREGDELFLMDGDGAFYRAHVTLASNHKCLYTIDEVLPQQPAWLGRTHLAIAPTKDMGRIEWLVEKATEVGFDAVTFLDCQFSERHGVRTDRVEKIVVSAVKQSRKAWKPTVHEQTPFRQFIDAHTSGQRFICHCYNEFPKADLFETLQSLPSDEETIVLVGPEGDFSVSEVEYALSKGFQSVSLGSSRLRTETAGLYAVMLAHLVKSGNKVNSKQ